MKIKLDLSKFKLGNNDGKMATLHHPDGHVVHIAVKALHPENRSNLDKLEKHVEPKEAKGKAKMADGGFMINGTQQQMDAKGGKVKMADGGSPQQNNRGAAIAAGFFGNTAAKTPPKQYADGGKVMMADGGSPQDRQKALAAGFFGNTAAKTAPSGSPAASPSPSAKPNYIYADGGVVKNVDETLARKKQIDDYNGEHMDQPKVEYPSDVQTLIHTSEDKTPTQGYDIGGGVGMMAEGGEADPNPDTSTPEDYTNPAPQAAPEGAYPAMPAQEPIQPMTPEEHARLYPNEEDQNAQLQASTQQVLDDRAKQMQDQAAADPDYIAHMRAAAAQYKQMQAQKAIDEQTQGMSKQQWMKWNTEQGVKKGANMLGQKMADGGSVADQAPVTVNVNGPQGNASPEDFNKNMDAYKNGATPQPQDQQQTPPAQTAPKQPQRQMTAPKSDPMASQVNPNAALTAAQTQRIGNAVMDNSAMAQMSANPNDPWGTQVTQGAMLQGINEQKQGAALAATGQTAQGQQIAQAAQSNINAAKKLQDANDQNFQALNGKRQDLMHDLQNAHIDPNRYINNMSTGQKIMSGIGLILGGAGGHGNMALDFLNKQIDRDIMSQQAEIGKKENLLGANMQDFKNYEDARDFTKVNLNDILSAQMKAQAAKFQGTQAAANLLQTAGQLDQQNAQLFGQLSMRRTLLQGGAQSGAGDVPPEMKIRGLIPAGPEQDKYFTQLGQAQSTVKARDNLINAFDQVAKLQTLGNRLQNPIQSKSQIASLVEPLTAGLSKETAGRYTEQDANAIKTLFPTMTDNAETVAKKRAQMIKTATEKMNYPELKSLGIDTENMGNSKALAGAPEVKTLNGVRYQKVAGGWKRI